MICTYVVCRVALFKWTVRFCSHRAAGVPFPVWIQLGLCSLCVCCACRDSIRNRLCLKWCDMRLRFAVWLPLWLTNTLHLNQCLRWGNLIFGRLHCNSELPSIFFNLSFSLSLFIVYYLLLIWCILPNPSNTLRGDKKKSKSTVCSFSWLINLLFSNATVWFQYRADHIKPKEAKSRR